MILIINSPLFIIFWQMPSNLQYFSMANVVSSLFTCAYKLALQTLQYIMASFTYTSKTSWTYLVVFLIKDNFSLVKLLILDYSIALVNFLSLSSTDNFVLEKYFL